MTDNFDPNNAKHVEIRQRIERGDGVVNMLSVKEGLEAFRESGCVTHSHFPSICSFYLPFHGVVYIRLDQLENVDANQGYSQLGDVPQ